MSTAAANPELLAKALFLEDLAWTHKISWQDRYKLYQQGQILDLDIEEIFERLALRLGSPPQLKPATWQSFIERGEVYSQEGLRLCFKGHEAWPTYLNSIADPPLWLWFKGVVPASLNGRSSVALVGARKILPYSSFLTQRLVKALTQKGHPIISGLAKGVDSLAHRTCLDLQGFTAALLPCGLDTCYPPNHQGLLEDICLGGGFVASEFPPAYPLRRENFHYRNRLISGLGLAVFIIQAGARSGSLITGRLAAEQGRDVYVAPASMEFEAYRGSLRLIADGARILDSYDLLDELLEEGSDRLAAYSKSQDVNLAKSWSQHRESGTGDQPAAQPTTPAPARENSPIKQGSRPQPQVKLGSDDLVLLQAIHTGINSWDKLEEWQGQAPADLVRRVARLESQGYLQRSRGDIFLTETAVSCIYYRV
ncbi:MAG: DNA-processing protein DprA [Eubacteriales bacterium]|nr:DNA-processing protein DprA [Eubacteriales bacterium]